jgi:hypothetical protein
VSRFELTRWGWVEVLGWHRSRRACVRACVRAAGLGVVVGFASGEHRLAAGLALLEQLPLRARHLHPPVPLPPRRCLAPSPQQRPVDLARLRARRTRGRSRPDGGLRLVAILDLHLRPARLPHVTHSTPPHTAELPPPPLNGESGGSSRPGPAPSPKLLSNTSESDASEKSPFPPPGEAARPPPRGPGPTRVP